MPECRCLVDYRLKKHHQKRSAVFGDRFPKVESIKQSTGRWIKPSENDDFGEGLIGDRPTKLDFKNPRWCFFLGEDTTSRASARDRVATSTLLLEVAELPQDSGETSFLSPGAQEDDHTIRVSLRQDRPNRKSTLIKSPNLEKTHNLYGFLLLTKASTIQRSFLEGVLGTLGLFSSRLRLADWTFHTNSTHGFLKGKMRGETSPVPFLHFPQPSSQSPPSIERHPCGLKGVPSIYRMRGRKNSRKFLKSSVDPAMYAGAPLPSPWTQAYRGAIASTWENSNSSTFVTKSQNNSLSSSLIMMI